MRSDPNLPVAKETFLQREKSPVVEDFYQLCVAGQVAEVEGLFVKKIWPPPRYLPFGQHLLGIREKDDSLRPAQQQSLVVLPVLQAHRAYYS